MSCSVRIRMSQRSSLRELSRQSFQYNSLHRPLPALQHPFRASVFLSLRRTAQRQAASPSISRRWCAPLSLHAVTAAVAAAAALPHRARPEPVSSAPSPAPPPALPPPAAFPP